MVNGETVRHHGAPLHHAAGILVVKRDEGVINRSAGTHTTRSRHRDWHPQQPVERVDRMDHQVQHRATIEVEGPRDTGSVGRRASRGIRPEWPAERARCHLVVDEGSLYAKTVYLFIQGGVATECHADIRVRYLYASHQP